MKLGDPFVCSLCGGEFASSRPDEEAHKEALQRYGKDGMDPNMKVVCSDCYEILKQFEERFIARRAAERN